MLAIVGALAAAAAGVWFRFGRDASGPPAVPLVRNAVQVTSTLDVESYPSWSPDGDRLAYQSHESAYWRLGNHDIWVVQLGSGEPRNLTKDSPANDRRPSWSPDGREIAFYSDRGGEWGVWIMPALGGNPRKVLSLPGPLNLGNQSWSAPQWAADGTRLFVLANEASGNVMIEVRLDTLGHSRIELPVPESPRRWDLSVRPDGQRFAYLEAGGGNPDLTRFWTIAASGGDPVPLTDGLTRLEPHLVERWTSGLLRFQPWREQRPLAASGLRGRTADRGTGGGHRWRRNEFRRLLARWRQTGLFARREGLQRFSRADPIGSSDRVGGRSARHVGARLHRVRGPLAR
jgi:hypothetical protein